MELEMPPETGLGPPCRASHSQDSRFCAARQPPPPSSDSAVFPFPLQMEKDETVSDCSPHT